MPYASGPTNVASRDFTGVSSGRWRLGGTEQRKIGIVYFQSGFIRRRLMFPECAENPRVKSGPGGRPGYILGYTMVEKSGLSLPVIASSQKRDGCAKGALIDCLVQG